GAAPGWAATDLGGALVAAAELLQMAAEGRDETGSLPPQIVLITDMQAGADLDPLSGYDWPADIRVDVRALRASKPTNAAALLLADLEPALDSQQTSLAVRVSNAADSSRDQFRLGWADAQGRLLGDREYPVTVPAGESRVVQVEPSPASSRLLLIGDDQPFDNTLYVARQAPRQRKLIYVGAEAEAPRGLLYFLRAASLDTPWQQVTVEAVPVEAPLPPLDPSQVPLVVLGAPVSASTGGQLRQQYVQRGGQVLVVLTRAADGGVDDDTPADPGTQSDPGVSGDVQADSSDNSRLAGLRRLLDLPGLRVEEAPRRDYAMLERIDFRHPLFQPLADPRFSDFTKIRFWNYRWLSADEEVTWNVLATFDDGSPALVEQPFGKGRCWVLASGWHPDESQLALSTKFVPLLAGLVDPLGGRPPLAGSYRVGQPIPLPEGQAALPIELPDGSRERPSGGTAFRQTSEPGIYRVGQGDQAQTVAVNIDPAESRTWPLDPAELEQRGLLTGKARTMAEIQDQQRQLRDVELESRQKWWRWLIFAALGILVAETCLAGWLSRGKPKIQG
ncbi:MAG: hypothetical protein J5I93_20790, partial [Pirellulaceae bacterium]|nr:hypothetical protein [Pirellulaceae bacterium]